MRAELRLANNSQLNSYVVGVYFLLVVVSTIFFASAAYTGNLMLRGQDGGEEEKQLVKAYIDNQLPNLDTLDDYEKATALRNYVYTHTRVGVFGPPVLPMTYEKFKYYISGQGALLCGGMAMEYIALLDLYGLSSRLVSLRTNDSFTTSINNTHVATEVYLNGKWVLQDPTFNVHWELQGKVLDTMELMRAFVASQNPIPKSDQYAIIPERSLDNYYLPYKMLLENIMISSVTAWKEPCAGHFKVEFVYPIREKIVVTHPSVVEGELLLAYDFSDGLASGWKLFNPETNIVSVKDELYSADIKRLRATNFNVLCYPHKYVAATNQPIYLTPGSYQLIIDGELEDGGIAICVINEQSHALVGASYYIAGEIDKGTPMVLDFSIKATGNYRLCLANNVSNYGGTSQWNISQVSVVRLPTITVAPA